MVETDRLDRPGGPGRSRRSANVLGETGAGSRVSPAPAAQQPPRFGFAPPPPVGIATGGATACGVAFAPEKNAEIPFW